MATFGNCVRSFMLAVVLALLGDWVVWAADAVVTDDTYAQARTAVTSIRFHSGRTPNVV